MSTSPNTARAEAAFKKEQRQRDGEQAMAEYEADRRATIEKTAKLRALRLARDAAEAAKPPAPKPAPKPAAEKKKLPAVKKKRAG